MKTGELSNEHTYQENTIQQGQVTYGNRNGIQFCIHVISRRGKKFGIVTLWNMTFVYVTFHIAELTSWGTQFVLIIKTIRLMMLKKTMAVYCENHTKHRHSVVNRRVP